jgi:hypothetical protein
LRQNGGPQRGPGRRLKRLHHHADARKERIERQEARRRSPFHRHTHGRVLAMRYLLCLIILVSGMAPADAYAGLCKAIIAKKRETKEGHLEKHRHKKVMRECKNGNC